jgi:hypothetical protein
MKRGDHKTPVLLSFVGTNDAGKLVGKPDGAVLTVFRKMRFDEVHLFWNPSSRERLGFGEIGKYLRSVILERGYAQKVSLHRFECANVTDHNEIYPKLLDLCKSLNPSPLRKFTAAIASGTPAMQVCWILMAESGDFPIQLIRSNEPKFGKPIVTPVRLSTALPRILRLEEENKQLRQEKEALIPSLQIRREDGLTQIGGTAIAFGPIESVYYRYFAERAKRGELPERLSGRSVPLRFLRQILEYHRESFPDADSSRQALERMVLKGNTLAIETFRGNVTKANKKLRQAISNHSLIKMFSITAEGVRNARTYALRLPAEKISII